jgi:hypothetical protein
MHLKLLRSIVLAGVLLIGASALSAQQSTPSIEVSGDVAQSLKLTAADLAKMPQATTQVTADGITTTYGGVWLHDVLKAADVPAGGDLRGKALTIYVLAEASDGYQVVFSLGELDPGTTDTQVLLADSSDGKPLFGAQGSFRLVIPKDKRGARSVRMLNKLTVVQVRK